MAFTDIYKNVIIKKDALVLGIESSCDDTCAAVVKGGREILSNVIITSAAEQAKYGGVVPEIASRAHTDAVQAAVSGALFSCGIELKDIDAIAVTYGAGLLGALLVGLSYAKALAFAAEKPLVGVSHIRGHIAASYLNTPDLKPPFIGLLASGGHTEILDIKSYTEHVFLGGTLDDAIGEAFDKTARVLGLGYPGGPAVEKLAREGSKKIALPKMLKGADNFDLSYSGLKTAVINYMHNAEQKGEQPNRADVAASFQSAAVDVLVDKAVKAAKMRGYGAIACGGGVIANGYLRAYAETKCREVGLKLYLPEKVLCTDNAAMIAAEGYIQYQNQNFSDLSLNAQAYLD